MTALVTESERKTCCSFALLLFCSSVLLHSDPRPLDSSNPTLLDPCPWYPMYFHHFHLNPGILEPFSFDPSAPVFLRQFYQGKKQEYPLTNEFFFII